MQNTKPKMLIQQIILEGSPSEKRELYGFDQTTDRKTVLKKFKLFARGEYPRFFQFPAAPFHDEMAMNMIHSYYGNFPAYSNLVNFLNIAGRGLTKTSLAKLFVAFVLLNDRDFFRKYMKALTKDGKNSKQFVTDVYNLIVEVKPIYGDVFQQKAEIKREETMGSFTMATGVKLAAGTVGQTQRGHVQDAFRPDWIIFDDVEDRDSIRSSVITQGIMDKISEAIDGLAKGGSWLGLANYISDQGVIEWLKQKPNVYHTITPLAIEQGDGFTPIWPKRDTPADIQNIRDNAEDFYGEYLCDPSRSENKFFDLDRIKAALENCKPPIRTSAGVKYWANYLPNHRYGLGSDHSEGVGLDSNTFVMFDFNFGEQIVSYHSNIIGPDLAACEACRVGAEFGNCVYAPETNNKCGGTALAKAQELGYPNIYKQVEIGKRTQKTLNKLGWNSNGSTKYNMFYEFRTDWNDGKIKINDQDILREMKAYTNSDLQDIQAGLVTRHFDLLTATVIAWQMHKCAVANSEGSFENYKKLYRQYYGG